VPRLAETVDVNITGWISDLLVLELYSTPLFSFFAEAHSGAVLSLIGQIVVPAAIPPGFALIFTQSASGSIGAVLPA
jgi:hypothetical protein